LHDPLFVDRFAWFICVLFGDSGFSFR